MVHKLSYFSKGSKGRLGVEMGRKNWAENSSETFNYRWLPNERKKGKGGRGVLGPEPEQAELNVA